MNRRRFLQGIGSLSLLSIAGSIQSNAFAQEVSSKGSNLAQAAKVIEGHKSAIGNKTLGQLREELKDSPTTVGTPECDDCNYAVCWSDWCLAVKQPKGVKESTSAAALLGPIASNTKTTMSQLVEKAKAAGLQDKRGFFYFDKKELKIVQVKD